MTMKRWNHTRKKADIPAGIGKPPIIWLMSLTVDEGVRFSFDDHDKQLVKLIKKLMAYGYVRTEGLTIGDGLTICITRAGATLREKGKKAHKEWVKIEKAEAEKKAAREAKRAAKAKKAKPAVDTSPAPAKRGKPSPMRDAIRKQIAKNKEGKA